MKEKDEEHFEKQDHPIKRGSVDEHHGPEDKLPRSEKGQSDNDPRDTRLPDGTEASYMPPKDENKL